MRTVRIYQPGSFHVGDAVALSSEASLHVGTVLRMHVGEALVLFSGDHQEHTAILTEVSRKKVCVRIEQTQWVERESPCAIHLVQGISKGERMEFVVQKAVELGVASITPVITTRCVVRLDAQRILKKQAQWQAIAVAACEQSGRNVVPVIHPVCSFEHYLQHPRASAQWILHPHAVRGWREVAPVNEMALLIGPEGGFTDEELQTAVAANCQPLRLGPRVLRTETAAIAALSVLQAACGDL